MKLPEELEQSFWTEVRALEEENHTPYLTSTERLGIKKGLAALARRLPRDPSAARARQARAHGPDAIDNAWA